MHLTTEVRGKNETWIYTLLDWNRMALLVKYDASTIYVMTDNQAVGKLMNMQCIAFYINSQSGWNHFLLVLIVLLAVVPFRFITIVSFTVLFSPCSWNACACFWSDIEIEHVRCFLMLSLITACAFENDDYATCLICVASVSNHTERAFHWLPDWGHRSTFFPACVFNGCLRLEWPVEISIFFTLSLLKWIFWVSTSPKWVL